MLSSTQHKRQLWCSRCVVLRFELVPPLDDILIFLIASRDFRLQGFHARQIRLDMVAGAGHLGLVLWLLRIRVLGDVGEEEVGMAVEKVVGILQIGLALVVGGLGGSRLGRGGVAVVWQHHLTWLIMFWAVRRAMLRGMLTAWSKLDASLTICSMLLGAFMLGVEGLWIVMRACRGGGC